MRELVELVQRRLTAAAAAEDATPAVSIGLARVCWRDEACACEAGCDTAVLSSRVDVAVALAGRVPEAKEIKYNTNTDCMKT